MKKFYLRTLTVAVALLFAYTSQAQNTPKVEEDPDLPSFGNVSKEEYLQARENYINLKRGFPNNLHYNARLKAIAEMRQQEQLIKATRTNSTLAANWTELGPSPIPNGQIYGVATPVPVTGRVTAIAIHPTDPNTVYVGTANGGIFRTTDGGGTWTAIFDGASSLAIGALALAPSSPTTLYVGTGEANASSDSYAGVGLYRIDNAATSPALIGPINSSMTFSNGSSNFTTTAFGFRTISKILVHPTDPATIFVSTSSGIAGNPNVFPSQNIPPLGLLGVYRSTNATSSAATIAFTKLAVTTANSFDVPNTGNRRISDMVMIPGNPNGIVCWVNGLAAAGDGGIYKTNNALAVTPVFTQKFTTTVDNTRGNLTIIKQGTDTVLYAATAETAAGTSCTTNSGAVRKSRDGGITWSTKLSGGGGFCGGQCFYDIAIDVAPNDSTKLLLGGSAGGGSCSDIVKKSQDAGATFIASQNGLHADSHVIAFAPSNSSIVYTGNDGGIFKSTDGGATWTSLNVSGFKATQFQSIALHPVDPNFTIGGTQDNGTNMLKPDGTFNRIDFGDGGYTLIDQNAVDNTNVTMYHTYYNQTNNQIAYARNDFGTSAAQGAWNVYGCNSGIQNGIDCSDATLFYAPMALGPGNPNTVYLGTSRLYRSSDKGFTNATVSQSPIVSGAQISSIAVSKQNDNVRIVGLTNGNVWATSSGSSTLTNVTPSAITVPVGRVAIDPTNPDIAYVTYDGYGLAANQHVWKTSNLSTTHTWTAMGTGIPDVPVNAFAIDPSNSLNIYAGTDIGVYQSTNGGTSWTAFNTGLPIVPVFDMAIHPVTRILKIATHGRGFFSTPLGITPITWVGATSNDWGTASNWSPNTVPLITSDVIIPATGLNMPVQITATKTCYNFTIQSGASATVTGTLQVGSQITNNGTFTATAGTIEMKGNSTQIIAANTFANNTISNLIINNNAVVSAGALNISGTLSFGNINNSIFSTSDLLTLKSTATNSAIIKDVTNAGGNSGNTFNGNVTVERFISAASSRSAWRLLTAPLKSTTGANGTIFDNWQNGGISVSGKATRVTGPAYNGSNGLDASTNGPSMKWFDGTALQPVITTNTPSTTPLFTTASSAANNSFFTFINGDRNAVFGSPNTTALSATGNLQTGNQMFTTNPSANGFTLIGNPYASPVDIDLFRQDNSSSNIKTTYYFWDPYLTGTYGYGGYVTVSYSGGSSYTITPGTAQTRYIQSGEAMFVQTKSPAIGTASVTFKETQKSSSIVNNIFRTQSTQKENFRINLNVISGIFPILVDGIVAEFDDNYSAVVDDNDAYKLYNTGESIAFMKDSTALSILRRPLIKIEDVLNLNLSSLKANRIYQFEFTPEFNAPAFKPFLKDNYLNTLTPIDVIDTTKIIFSVNSDVASAGANRFSIVFSKSPVYTNNPDLYIYPNPITNGIVHIQFNNMPQGNYQVRILNSMGQTILNNQINHAPDKNTETIQLKNKTKGVYHVEIIKPDNSKFIKKIIAN